MKGYRYSVFFHRMTKVKCFVNVIFYLRNITTIIQYPIEMANHVVNYFNNILCFADNYQSSNVIKEVIPKLVDTNMNNMLSTVPYKDEIRKATFSLNKNSASGLDGFRGVFFQTYWEIIEKHICNVILQLFKLFRVFNYS